YNGYVGEPLHSLSQHLDVQMHRLRADVAHLEQREQERAATARPPVGVDSSQGAAEEAPAAPDGEGQSTSAVRPPGPDATGLQSVQVPGPEALGPPELAPAEPPADESGERSSGEPFDGAAEDEERAWQEALQDLFEGFGDRVAIGHVGGAP